MEQGTTETWVALEGFLEKGVFWALVTSTEEETRRGQARWEKWDRVHGGRKLDMCV